MPENGVSHPLRQRFFDAAREEVEAAAPALRRRRVNVADLPREMLAAEAFLADARSGLARPPGSEQA